jgi:hypothetical protein
MPPLAGNFGVVLFGETVFEDGGVYDSLVNLREMNICGKSIGIACGWEQ